MKVTKQQQLEWLASAWTAWGNPSGEYVEMSSLDIGVFCVPTTYGPIQHKITSEEWQHERDKMQKQDNSWHERGSCPPIGVPVELWFGGSFAYNCEFICMWVRNYIVWNLDADRPDCADIMNSEFRPLRTEREKAIDEMVSGYQAVKGDKPVHPRCRFFAEYLYDSGYRKEQAK